MPSVAAVSAGFETPTKELLQDLTQLSQAERLQRAEAARGGLVQTWKAKAQTEGKGRDYRGILPNECMADLPALMEARDGLQPLLRFLGHKQQKLPLLAFFGHFC